MENPLVSIIIPTFNRAHLIGETLESVIAQTYQNWECIVVDDGSTDYTEELMEIFCKKNNRFQFYHRPATRNKGASACRNFGFQQSKGDLIQYLDSDDILSSNKLEDQVSILNTNLDFTLATCLWGRFSINIDDSTIYKNLESYKNFNSSREFFIALTNSLGYFPPHAYLIRRELIIKSGLWNEYLSLNDDGEFMTRIISNSSSIRFAPEAIAYYRLPTGNNLGSYNSIEKVQDGINSWKLIEAFLKIRYKENNIYFVEKAKEILIDNLNRTYPGLIKLNSNFLNPIQKRSGFLSNMISSFMKIMRRW